LNQTELFYDTLFDAIGADIAAAGGYKTVAGKLWPHEPIETTTARLRNGINTEQAQKLCPTEVLAIKRLAHEVGSTATIDYEAQQLGYQVTWVNPKDEGDRLRREFIENAKAMQRLAERIQRADERAAK
jgi:hypothetical protein